MMSQNNQEEIINYYLYGTVITRYGLASLNHGMRQGNKTLLQKVFWENKIHSLVSSSAIRWALRFYLQKKGYLVNRVWDENEHINRLINEAFDPEQFYDDDIFGFALLESAENENNEGEAPPSSRRRRRNQTQVSNNNQRMGALAMNHAISLTPYNGALLLGAKSGREKDSTSLHFTEYHATRYQYYFGVNATHLNVQSRIFELIDGIMDIPKVGGNSNIFNYPFLPDSFVFQWTNHFSSYVSYCFEACDATEKKIKLKKDFVNEIECGQIESNELWFGGPIVEELQQLENFEKLNLSKVHLYRNRRTLVEDLKEVITRDLRLNQSS
ncbi:CRISPR-associated protein [Aphanothece hegewaldii CCALA 016]|uniref:CRISPR-associated protein n=1 Tax=Aphanothece hegewaldii CCALA 016 TaxID=2107694 RepID=A0A2T1M030_9CHRO|nr:CRISPR-associated protein [Aphanothece hegewaldii]PSF37990.1 CRISPR-associated protein [Aphanothece hegewaldii CCALA 016]